jgi:hypothetical protein
MSKQQNEKFMQQIEEEQDRADKVEQDLAEVAKSEAIHQDKTKAGGVLVQGLFWGAARCGKDAKGVPGPPLDDKEHFYGEHGPILCEHFGVRCEEYDFHFSKRCHKEWQVKFSMFTCVKCPWCLGPLPMEIAD